MILLETVLHHPLEVACAGFVGARQLYPTANSGRLFCPKVRRGAGEVTIARRAAPYFGLLRITASDPATYHASAMACRRPGDWTGPGQTIIAADMRLLCAPLVSAVREPRSQDMAGESNATKEQRMIPHAAKDREA